MCEAGKAVVVIMSDHSDARKYQRSSQAMPVSLDVS